jgi:hypothetical protein
MADACTNGIDTGFVALGYATVAVLGVVQGIAELKPISSTAHMRIVPALFGWQDPGSAFSAAALTASEPGLRPDLEWSRTQPRACRKPSSPSHRRRNLAPIDFGSDRRASPRVLRHQRARSWAAQLMSDLEIIPISVRAGATVSAPVRDWHQAKFTAPAYYKFESIFLQRRVCKLSVPRALHGR